MLFRPHEFRIPWLLAVTRRYRPNSKKKGISAMQAIKIPPLRSSIGLINFYRDMSPHRSHFLTPLTALLSKNVISRDVLLTFPDFSKPFETHTVTLNSNLVPSSIKKANPSPSLTKTKKRETSSLTHSADFQPIMTLSFRRSLLLRPQWQINSGLTNCPSLQFFKY